MKKILLILLLSFSFAFNLNEPRLASNIGFSYMVNHALEENGVEPLPAFLVTQGLGLLHESRQKVMDADDLVANLMGSLGYRFVVTIKF